MVHPQNQSEETLKKKRKAEDALEQLRESTAVATAAAARLQEALLVHNETIADARAAAARGPKPITAVAAVPTAAAAAPVAQEPKQAAATELSPEPHFLVGTTMTAPPPRRHARVVCELCRLWVRECANKAETNGDTSIRYERRTGLRVTTCCPTCRLGFHQECFIAYHYPEKLRDCNPVMYERVQVLKKVTLRNTRESPSTAIPVNYFETMILPFMKKNPESSIEHVVDES